MSDRDLMQQALEALTTYDGTNGESKRKRVLAALRERLARPNEFEPDWDQVEALQESLREHMAEIHRLRQWQGLTDEKKVKRVYFPTSWITPVPLRKR